MTRATGQANAKQRHKKAHEAFVKLSFKPKAAVKKLVSELTDRSRDVIVKRYGLGDDPTRMTLEAIGGAYSITRERVRQIENYTLATLRKSDGYKEAMGALKELESAIEHLGGIVPEWEFLELVSADKSTQNHIHFLLVLGDRFIREKETDDFSHRWHTDESHARRIETALTTLYENLDDADLIPESEMIDRFLGHLKDMNSVRRDREVVKRWLSLSKRIARNPLGEYGRSSSSNVNIKGIRDYAYLVIRSHGSPMHFTEVARKITELFDREAHVATCHNELIKDERFVLVGRGLYALSEWGYIEGVVKDVIKHILAKQGPLTRDEIINRVLKERYVKGNTVLVNLQDQRHFKKLKDGRYAMV